MFSPSSSPLTAPVGTEGSVCPYRLALAKLQQPTTQLALAACFVVLAAVAAWYMM